MRVLDDTVVCAPAAYGKTRDHSCSVGITWFSAELVVGKTECYLFNRAREFVLESRC